MAFLRKLSFGRGFALSGSTSKPRLSDGLAIWRQRYTSSRRLLWLTIAIVLATELLIFLPGLSWDRQVWLSMRSLEASIGVQSFALAPNSSRSPAAIDTLLQSSGTLAIRLVGTGVLPFIIGPIAPLPQPRLVDIRTADALSGMLHALASLVGAQAGSLRVVANSSFLLWDEIQFDIPAAQLAAELRRFASIYAGISLVIVSLSTMIVYIALRLLLVLPLRRITRSIVAFRADPSGTTPLDLNAIRIVADEEITLAGQELAAMQCSLRDALMLNARLADVGLAVVKFGHDMRNVLSPAVLTSERLASCADPAVAQSGVAVLHALDRATELLEQTLEFVRSGRTASSLSRFSLAILVDEVAEGILSEELGKMENRVGRAIEVVSRRTDLFRVLGNLIRNSTQAGANLICVECSEASDCLAIDVTDNGPGLPDQVLRTLFQPFTRSAKAGSNGIGLVIARDLMRTQEGDLTLQSTGASGTTFRLTMSMTLPALSEF